ncbi:MAG: hypothetical protein ACK5QC_08855 [Bacteroidota bacterium]
MKFNTYLLSLVLMIGFIGINLKAQDTLFLRNSSKVVVKLSEITPTQLKYKRFDNMEGPNYAINKSEVDYVIFANGLKEQFELTSYNNSNNNTSTQPIINNAPSSQNSNNQIENYGDEQTELKGRIDARRYYTHNGGAIGTGVTSFFCGPVCGLIPAIAINNNEPKDENLGMPVPEKKDYRYKLGYKQEAYKIKRRKNWIAYGVGSVSGIAAAIIIGIALGGI